MCQVKLNKFFVICFRKPFISILLPSGHKIGKPAPLFAKLEQSFIDEMKKKYAGPQVLSSTTSQANSINIADLEKAIQEQGDKVRQLKASTKDKTVWQPEVNKLLDLKKQLTEAQSKQAPATIETKPNGNVSSNIKDLELAVQAQGDKVRQLKASTKDKTVWQPEVNKLLDLKKQLAEAQSATSALTSSTSAPTTPVDTNKVKELEDKIAKQAEKVRTLKASSDASVWKPEVEILLSFKKELSALTGVPESNAQSKNKKKK